MGIDVDLKIKNVKKIISDFRERKKNIKNMRGVNLAAVVTMLSWVQRNFKQEGRLHSNSNLNWPNLKQSTINARRKGKGSGFPKILRDTGNLMNRWERKANNEVGTLKSKQNYSSVHEFGSKARNIPVRKIFPEDEQGRKIVLPVYKKWTEKNIVDV